MAFRDLNLGYFYYPVALALAIVLIANVNAISAEDESLSHYQSTEQRTDTVVKKTLEIVSFGLYKGASEKADAIASIERSTRARSQRVRLATWTLAGLSAAFLMASLLRERRAGLPGRRRLVRDLLGVSCVFLLVGLTTPILTVVAHKEVAVLGDVVLQHESKGIVSTFSKLFQSGNLFIAFLLLVFSIVIPLLKLAISFVVLLAPRLPATALFLRCLQVVGKWSMTDVFVVAVLLAFFAADSGELTNADLEHGLYFFAGYGLLSLLASQLLISCARLGAAGNGLASP